MPEVWLSTSYRQVHLFHPLSAGTHDFVRSGAAFECRMSLLYIMTDSVFRSKNLNLSVCLFVRSFVCIHPSIYVSIHLLTFLLLIPPATSPVKRSDLHRHCGMSDIVACLRHSLDPAGLARTPNDIFAWNCFSLDAGDCHSIQDWHKNTDFDAYMF